MEWPDDCYASSGLSADWAYFASTTSGWGVAPPSPLFLPAQASPAFVSTVSKSSLACLVPVAGPAVLSSRAVPPVPRVASVTMAAVEPTLASVYAADVAVGVNIDV